MTPRPAPHRFAAEAGPDGAHLRLLHVSDLHARLAAWDYLEDAPDPGAGLAALIAPIARARAEAPGALLFDGGDMLQGPPLGDLAARDWAAAPHPVIAALNAVGVDAAVFGNHDFNYGLELAQKAAAEAAFPVVLANIRRAGTAPGAGAELLPPWAVLDRRLPDGAGRMRGVKVGVFGVCPPQVMQWDAALLTGRVEAEDIAPAAARAVAALQDAGAEVIVALCHSGIDPAAPETGAENAALSVAAIPGVDAVLTGHQHRRLPGPNFAGTPGVDAAAGRLGKVPAVMPGSGGEWLGVVDLRLEHDGARWRVAEGEARLLPAEGGAVPAAARAPELAGAAGLAEGAPAFAPVPARPADPAELSDPAALAARLSAVSDGAHQRILSAVRAPAGESLAPIRSRFALVAESAPVRLTAMAGRAWMDRVLDGDESVWDGAERPAPDPRLPELSSLPRLAAAAPFRAGWRAGPRAFIDIQAGRLERRHLDQVYPFPNPMALILADGAALRLWLERSAATWAEVAPGARDVPLLMAEAAPYNLDHLDGLDWEIDLSRPALFDPAGTPTGAPVAEGRIRALTHDGRPVRDGDLFAVAANAYRAGGGGRFPGMPGLPAIPAPETPATAALADWLLGAGPVDPSPLHAWRFAPVPGASAILHTAHDAPSGAAAAAETGGMRLEDAGTDADGFGLRRILF